MPGLLALDQATTLGWSHALPGQEPVWGTKRFEGQKGAGFVGAALWAFLEDLTGRFAPDWIVYEAPYVPTSAGKARVPTNAETMRRLLGMAFLIDTFAELHSIECREIASVAATKHMTGRGRYPDRKAKKRAVMQACWARGWKVGEDEADALALLLFAESLLCPAEAYRRARVMKPIQGPLFA